MQKFTKTQYHLDIISALSIIESLDIEWNDQLSITSRTGTDLFDGVGRRTEYSDCNEKDFGIINREFIGTCIENLLDTIKADGYSIGRARVMRMRPKTTYTYHMDCEPRLHFALTTSSKSMMILDDEVYRVPADGCGYLLDTTLPHTAVNASLENRIHIVINLLIPVTRTVYQDNFTYRVLDMTLTQDEFDKWLVETKPPTEPRRMDYYFVN